MKAKCALWGTSAEDLESNRDGAEFDCRRAGGRYFITGSALGYLPTLDDKARALLTTYLVDQRRLGAACPEITSTILERLSSFRPLSASDRTDRLLRFLGEKTSHVGEEVYIEYKNANEAEILAHTESLIGDEISFLLEYLQGAGLCTYLEYGGGADATVTVAGYERLATLDSYNSSSQQAFVAMWFDESLNEAFELGMLPAITEAGYVPIRIDRKDHNNKIDDEIVAEIRKSHFLVADFTHGTSGARGGVYYEAGLAHGLGMQVIFCARDDMIDKTHFDTRQYNHIFWTDYTDLHAKLKNRILATLGQGPVK